MAPSEPRRVRLRELWHLADGLSKTRRVIKVGERVSIHLCDGWYTFANNYCGP
jgi:hypothetical protein